MLSKSLLERARENSLFLFLTIFMGLGIGIVIVLQAKLLSLIISRVFLENFSLAELQDELLFIILLIFLRALFLFIRNLASGEVSARVMFSLRNELFARIIGFGPVRMGNESTGNLSNVVFQGVEKLDVYFREYLPQLVLAVIIPVLVLIFVFPLDFLTGLIFLVTAPLIPLFMILIGKQAENETLRQWKLLSRLSGYYFEVLQGLETLKNFGQSNQKKNEIRAKNEQYADVTLRVLRIAFLSALVLEIVATISTAVVAVQIGVRLLYGQMLFVDGLFLLILAPEYYFPLRQLGASFHAGREGISASESIFSILDEEFSSEKIKKKSEIKFSEKISFSNVTYQYLERDKPSVEDLNFSIERGQQVALVGGSGGGKSTVIALLMGFISAQKGEIWIDDERLNASNVSSWRQNIAYIPQFPYLFSGTLTDNMRIANNNSTFDEVKQAISLANADEFVSALPEQYDTFVGENGAKISRGQAQRLAIARAVLRKAPLLVIDEPTSSLDPENEKMFRKVLHDLMGESTVVVVAHRLSTVMDADKILVIDNGRLIQAGTHDQLLAQGGRYSELIHYTRGTQ